jgi:hypothetical protein
MKDVVEVLDSTDCFNNSDNDNLNKSIMIRRISSQILKKLLKEDEEKAIKGKN